MQQKKSFAQKSSWNAKLTNQIIIFFPVKVDHELKTKRKEKNLAMIWFVLYF